MTPDLTPATKKICPPVSIDLQTWRAAVRRELDRLADELERDGDPRSADWCRIRGERLADCGTHGTAVACYECGGPVPGSYRPAPYPVGYCETRACPWCARRRAARSAQLGDRISEQEWATGCSWWLATLTCARDATDPAAASVSALRERAQLMRRSMTRLIKELRRGAGVVAAWGGIELSTAAGGHVHAHVLIAAPAGAALGDTEGDRSGSAWWAEFRAAAGLGPIGDCRPADPGAVAEVLKYAVKSPDPARWAVEPLRVVSPTLAARWELAIRGVRLRERWGLARSLKWDDPEDEYDDGPMVDGEADDWLAISCPRCRSSRDLMPVAGRSTEVLAWMRDWDADPLRGPRPPRADFLTSIQLGRCARILSRWYQRGR